MAIKHILTPPPHVPEELVTEWMRMGLYLVVSDNVNFNDTSPVTIFRMPPNTYVYDISCEIVTAFAGGTPSIDVGVSGATARHLPSADITEGTTGFYGNATHRPFRYTAKTDIIVTLSASLTAGVARFFLTFRPLSNLQKLG